MGAPMTPWRLLVVGETKRLNWEICCLRPSCTYLNIQRGEHFHTFFCDVTYGYEHIDKFLAGFAKDGSTPIIIILHRRKALVCDWEWWNEWYCAVLYCITVGFDLCRSVFQLFGNNLSVIKILTGWQDGRGTQTSVLWGRVPKLELIVPQFPHDDQHQLFWKKSVP